jgi:hypothetical protein
MKRFVLLSTLFCFLFSSVVSAQSTRKEREEAWRKARTERREKEKALESIQDSIAYSQALEALKQGSWVLEANDIMFRSGIVRYVSSSTNYVSVNDGNGVVQTAFTNFIYSPNGLGGVTVQGSVSGVSMNMDKDGNVYYNCSILGAGISATLNLTLTGGTNQASIYVSPNFNGNTLTMNGNLVPYESSSVFQGTPLF